MRLALLAQDIHVLNLALVADHQVKKITECFVAPEQYLKTIDDRMCEWGIGLSELSGVVVVTGPGSFTSCRVITTIANTIGYTQGIPVTGMENPAGLSLEELLGSEAIVQDSGAFALPMYGRPPNITYPKIE